MKNVFEKANEYYKRNRGREQLEDLLQAHLRTLPLKNKRVLDIGCETGFRLNDLSQYGALGYGIDASSDAIRDGLKKHPILHLEKGSVDQLPYRVDFFDFVFINFVFYALPREMLFRSVSKIDYVLKDGGHLIIGDFYPDVPHCRADRHSVGEFTYKQDYVNLFTESGLYCVEKTIKHEFRSIKEDASLMGGDNQSIITDLVKRKGSFLPVRAV